MSKAMIKLYKGVFLVRLQSKLIKDGAIVSIDEVDALVKKRADLEGSTKQMNQEDLHGLCLECISFGEEIGLKLSFPDDKNEFPYWEQ
jgi:hypothetical protein